MRIRIARMRCFTQPTDIVVRPITLLVGENSSGKTTAIAAIAAALSRTFPDPSAFNTPPFQLGDFSTIVSRGAASFSISLQAEVDGASVSQDADFASSKSGIRVSEFEAETATFDLRLKFSATKVSGTFRIKGSRGRPLQIDSKIPRAAEFSGASNNLEYLVYTLARRKLRTRLGRSDRYREAFNDLSLTFPLAHHLQSELRALAPLRTSPERTYDEIAEAFDPAGQHVPRLLRRTLGDTAKADQLRKSLSLFGQSSGLFESVSVRTFMDSGGPFQIEVSQGGKPVNLMDVGYGVSQSLPVVIEAINAPRGARLVIQQPEVHLHPKAQAGLASLLVNLSKQPQKSFVVETHSDYIVDRLRMHIKKGDISPDAVSLVFLQRGAKGSSANNLRILEDGSIENPPPAYRDFFIREQLELL